MGYKINKGKDIMEVKSRLQKLHKSDHFSSVKV